MKIIFVSLLMIIVQWTVMCYEGDKSHEKKKLEKVSTIIIHIYKFYITIHPRNITLALFIVGIQK